MSYQEALEAAGATVHSFDEFGSYQGDWYAKVTYAGITGWVTGSFGSCSHCDAFEAEFGWGDEENSDYEDRLSDFGREYLEQIMTQEEAEKLAQKNIEWDFDAEKVLQHLRANAVKE